MKNYFLNKTGFVFAIALIAQFSAFADSKEISKAKDFVNYCGTGSRYKSCDDIILTADIELTSDITLRKNLKIRSMLCCAKVAQAERIGAVIGETAGLCAGAAVSASSADKRAEQALSRMADAERAVQEDLDLGLGMRNGVADVFKRKLSCQNDSRDAKRIGEKIGTRTRMDRRLRACVKLKVGDLAADQAHQSEVCDDQSVDTEAIEGLGI